MIAEILLGSALLTAATGSSATGQVRVKISAVERVRVSTEAIAGETQVRNTDENVFSSHPPSHQFTIDISPCDTDGSGCESVLTLRYE